MKFRSIDTDNDWNVGRGVQSYATDLQALTLNLRTRILSWVGDCFFDLDAGVDWKNLLEYNQKTQLIDAIKAIAFRTAGVLRVYDIVLTVTNRTAGIAFSVDTIFGPNVQNAINLSVGG
jgi:hypothetical protein